MAKRVVAKDLLKANDQIANANRRRLDSAGIRAVNLLGSAGAGKTSLLEALFRCHQDPASLAVIEGDLATTEDADRIEQTGVRVIQINTDGGCHLDANMVEAALSKLDLDGVKRLFIENVGNLVCPANYRLGEDLRVVVLSVAEGPDKVAKYPPIFQATDAVVVSKADLLPYIDFDSDRLASDLARIAPAAKVFHLSAKTGEGIEAFAAWLE